MKEPTIVSVPEWAWTRVATNVVTGVIHRLTTVVDYYHTYRLTGNSAPTAPTVGTIPSEAVRMFANEHEEIIESTDSIDVYVMSANRDDDSTDTGSVRVDV